MNKIVITLLTIFILNALALPTIAGERKAKSISNTNTSDIQTSRSNQVRSGQNYRDVNVNSGEMSMIELQSVVSNRATSLQGATGMVKAINESQKTINENIGR